MSTTGSKPVLLAIDDDAIILNTVISTLKAEFSVRPFTSGETALKYLADHSADMILLDNKMPGMSGLEVLKRLQADVRTATIPTIFLTGSVDGESEVEALELGAIDYIYKPVKPKALLTRVRLQLELQNHRKHMEALVEEKTRDLNRAYRKLQLREDITLNILARATDLRDHETGGHIERTTEFVRIMTEELLARSREPGYALSHFQADDIIKSAKLHDLGKIAIPDHILLKPGSLTAEEFETIKMHPAHGEKLLTDFIQQMEDPFLITARDIAYAHHERWDGSGYPLGLKAYDIPLSARIVAIADVYDALTSVRPYKKACSHQQALEIILESSGRHFDPYLVEIFKCHEQEISQMTSAA